MTTIATNKCTHSAMDPLDASISTIARLSLLCGYTPLSSSNVYEIQRLLQNGVLIFHSLYGGGVRHPPPPPDDPLLIRHLELPQPIWAPLYFILSEKALGVCVRMHLFLVLNSYFDPHPFHKPVSAPENKLQGRGWIHKLYRLGWRVHMGVGCFLNNQV